MLDHYSYYLKALEEAAEGTLRAQCTDENSPLCGTTEDFVYGIDNAHRSIGAATVLSLAYLCPGCAYEGDEALLHRAAIAMEHALSLQNEDGTLDLATTNFHDASETGFCVQSIAPVYLFMRERITDSPAERHLAELIYTFLDRSADGLLCGGFHTPNHRWVQSAALALCYRATGRKECLDRMHLFLNEGIDCDENGEYTERSTGVYNTVCNRSLIYIAHYANMPELLEHVKRNLTMVLDYIEPDFTLNTMNSTRQDVGTGPDWKLYYGSYLYMALKTGDARFAGIADMMLEQLEGAYAAGTDRRAALFEFMPMMLPEGISARLAGIKSARHGFDCEHFYEKSGVVRKRAGECSLTLLTGSPCFLKLQCGRHQVYMRAAASFYARAQFKAQEITGIDGGYRLSFSDRWGYKQPFSEAPSTSVWREMDHSQRESVMMQDFAWTMDVYPSEKGIVIKTAAGGTDNVPAKLEIMLEPGGVYENEAVLMNGSAGGYVYQRCAASEYRYLDYRKLKIDGGFFAHYSGANMRGSLPADASRFTVAFTAFTPFDKEISLNWA